MSAADQTTVQGRQWVPYLVIWLVALGLFAAVAIPAEQAIRHLGDPAVASGYWLLGVMLFLALFNSRKRVPMIPLLRAKWWTTMHTVGGILALGVFWLHTRTLWPTGPYEQALAVLFYLLTLSGALGWIVVRTAPSRLTQTAVEVIYERIPTNSPYFVNAPKPVVMKCTTESNADTLARIYAETFDWFFRRPRFLLHHLVGSRKGTAWIFQQVNTAKRYLNQTEQDYLNEILNLASIKNRIDYHYAVQGMIKIWLLFHVPLATALLCLSLWHLILIHVYVI